MGRNEIGVDTTRILLGLILSIIIGGLAYWRRSLTASGWVGAILTGTATFGFGGWTWGGGLILFFVSSSLLSRYRSLQKQRLVKDTFAKGSRRDIWQALANGGAGAILALVSALLGAPPALLGAFAGVMGTVTADTWATEIGVLSRSAPRLITTMRPVDPGTSGGVSFLGTLATLVGGLCIGGALTLLAGWEYDGGWTWLIVAGGLGGLLGSLTDSLLGATMQAMYQNPQGHETERRTTPSGQQNLVIRGLPWMTNDLVNLLSSLAGGFVGFLVGVWLGG